MYKVIAVEIPFLTQFHPVRPVNACISRNKVLYLYNIYKELIPLGDYDSQISAIQHTVYEGKYEWTYFTLHPGDSICRNFDNEIVRNGEIQGYKKLGTKGKSKISSKSIRLFNQFLRDTNKDNPAMVDALVSSLDNGYFRREVEEIIENDEISELAPPDREIITRIHLEGSRYIENYVDRHLDFGKPDRFIEINYFFRRVFNLEVYNYISLNTINPED